MEDLVVAVVVMLALATTAFVMVLSVEVVVLMAVAVVAATLADLVSVGQSELFGQATHAHSHRLAQAIFN
jgi:hypothetical protein